MLLSGLQERHGDKRPTGIRKRFGTGPERGPRRGSEAGADREGVYSEKGVPGPSESTGKGLSARKRGVERRERQGIRKIQTLVSFFLVSVTQFPSRASSNLDISNKKKCGVCAPWGSCAALLWVSERPESAPEVTTSEFPATLPGPCGTDL